MKKYLIIGFSWGISMFFIMNFKEIINKSFTMEKFILEFLIWVILGSLGFGFLMRLFSERKKK